jgi:ATP-binding cassette subfamily C protein
VALVPHSYQGYRMRAVDPASGRMVQWRVDEELASRLAPHAFTFHRRFPGDKLDARAILRFVVAHAERDIAFLIVAGLIASLIGLITPLATGWLIDKAIPSGATRTVLAVIAGLAVAGVSLIALNVLRTLAILRFETRVGVAKPPSSIASSPPRRNSSAPSPAVTWRCAWGRSTPCSARSPDPLSARS